MNAHQRLERQLRTSVANSGDHRPALLARLRLWSRGLPVVLIASLTTVAVAAAAVSVVLTRPPDPGPIPRDVDDSVVAAGFNFAYAKDRLCRPTFTASKPTSATPSKQMLATVPILTKPATAADRAYARLYVRTRRPLLSSWGGEMYVRYIRQARVADGYTFYLIPLAGLGRKPLSAIAANRCDTLARTWVQTKLPSVPAAKRAATRRYADANYTDWRYNLETSHLYDGIALQAQADYGGGGGFAPLTQIRRTGMLGQTDSVWYGIVPPQVATVTLRFPHGRNHNGRHLPLYVRGNVINSVFTINIPSNPTGGGWPTTEYWRSASGKLIKTVNEEQFHP
jgi:hypothetical protein